MLLPETSTLQHSEHSTVQENDNGHDDHEKGQECQVRVSSHVQARDTEKKRLKEFFIIKEFCNRLYGVRTFSECKDDAKVSSKVTREGRRGFRRLYLGV